MTAALDSQHSPKASVRSAFDVPEKQQVAIRKAIKDTFASDAAIKFQTAPELVGGIELIGSSQRLGWSIADYLVAMEAGRRSAGTGTKGRAGRMTASANPLRRSR